MNYEAGYADGFDGKAAADLSHVEYMQGWEDGEAAYDAAYTDDTYSAEPDLDFGFEHDSSMASAGWGTDEDYGFFGGDE